MSNDTKKTRARYVCANCGAGQVASRIKAMRKAGWSLWHMSCRECGQSQIRDMKPSN